MQSNHFKKFMKQLENEQSRNEIECCAYIFLNLTPKQSIKVINLYIENGLTKIENGYILFGKNYCYNMKIEKYKMLCGDSTMIG